MNLPWAAPPKTLLLGSPPILGIQSEFLGGPLGDPLPLLRLGNVLLPLVPIRGDPFANLPPFCGVVGLKPTYGLVSRYGLVAYASSLDQIGPLAPTVTDAAILLRAIAGHDPKDATSLRVPVPDYTQALKPDLEGMRIGLIQETVGEGVQPEVKMCP